MEGKVAKTVYLSLAIIVCAFMLFPLYWTIVSSLKNNTQLFAFPQTFFPPTPQWNVYSQAFGSQWPHLVVSLVVSLGTVVLSLLISLPAAYALAQFKLKITVVFVLILLIVQMIPSISLANALFLIFHNFHLLNSYQGLILADSTYAVPFDVLILRAFIDSIPRELIEAGFVDGAGNWLALIRIVTPISKSAIITAALFSFLFAWGDFLYALTVTTTNSIQPITLSIYQYIGSHSTEWNSLMATAVLASIPAGLLLIFTQRYINAGISTSGIK